MRGAISWTPKDIGTVIRSEPWGSAWSWWIERSASSASLDDPAAALVEDLADLGQAHAAGGPDEELGAEALLEGGELAADRGLGEAETAGGGREAAGLDQLGEHDHGRDGRKFGLLLMRNDHIQKPVL
jgi:hypothetical protein